MPIKIGVTTALHPTEILPEPFSINPPDGLLHPFSSYSVPGGRNGHRDRGIWEPLRTLVRATIVMVIDSGGLDKAVIWVQSCGEKAIILGGVKRKEIEVKFDIGDVLRLLHGGFDLKVNVTDINGNWATGKTHIDSALETLKKGLYKHLIIRVNFNRVSISLEGSLLNNILKIMNKRAETLMKPIAFLNLMDVNEGRLYVMRFSVVIDKARDLFEYLKLLSDTLSSKTVEGWNKLEGGIEYVSGKVYSGYKHLKSGLKEFANKILEKIIIGINGVKSGFLGLVGDFEQAVDTISRKIDGVGDYLTSLWKRYKEVIFEISLTLLNMLFAPYREVLYTTLNINLILYLVLVDKVFGVDVEKKELYPFPRYSQSVTPTCASTSLLMVLHYFGKMRTYSDIRKGIDNLTTLRDGLLATQIINYLKKEGIYESYFDSPVAGYIIKREILKEMDPLLVRVDYTPITPSGDEDVLHRIVLIGYLEVDLNFYALLVDPNLPWYPLYMKLEDLNNQTDIEYILTEG
ncbi:MAG: hypothetical protein DRN35_05065 [Thermoplasmata archaeon]|nr:MAG: hypothetical protein DRN35_05065 [Thermoplasmata archaeon]